MDRREDFYRRMAINEGADGVRDNTDADGQDHGQNYDMGFLPAMPTAVMTESSENDIQHSDSSTTAANEGGTGASAELWPSSPPGVRISGSSPWRAETGHR